MTIYQKMQMQLLVLCSMLFLSFASYADVDTAPAKASEFVAWFISLSAEFGPIKTAVITVMGILILVLGIIQLGGFVAGVMKKMLG